MAAEMNRPALLALGFDPGFVDAVLADFAADAPLVMQSIADFKAMGFGLAWIVDMVQTWKSAGPKFFADFAALMGLTHPVIMAVKHHPLAKASDKKAAARPFLDWLLANGPALLSLLLKLFGTPVKP